MEIKGNLQMEFRYLLFCLAQVNDLFDVKDVLTDGNLIRKCI